VFSPKVLATERDKALSAVADALGIDRWPGVPVRWNRRLRLAGRAVVERRRAGEFRAGIELSPAYFEVYPADLFGILVHEAVHVGLAVLGRPFGHGPAFRAACEEAGGMLHSRNLPGRVLQYRCPVCAKTLERRRRPSGDRWCAPCAGTASEAGVAPFTLDRALVLVGCAFRGMDERGGEGDCTDDMSEGPSEDGRNPN
jgi:predicted SprT family Zn-dependent metalloprotease